MVSRVGSACSDKKTPAAIAFKWQFAYLSHYRSLKIGSLGGWIQHSYKVTSDSKSFQVATHHSYLIVSLSRRAVHVLAQSIHTKGRRKAEVNHSSLLRALPSNNAQHLFFHLTGQSVICPPLFIREASFEWSHCEHWTNSHLHQRTQTLERQQVFLPSDI